MFCQFRISVVVLAVMVVKMNANLINVALFKETIQSSTLLYAARLAADGNTNQNWVGSSCTHTHTQNQPYWEVDLGSSYVIAFIKVYNRLDCCSDRLSNVEVTVSTDHVTYVRYGYHLGAIGSTYEFYPENPVVVGRWVKIMLIEGTYILSLCEVEIMSNMTYRRDYLRKVRGVKGTGTITATIPVVSETQCVFLCMKEAACHSVNVKQYNTPSTYLKCQLLNHVSYIRVINSPISFWTMSTDL